jgi:tRNA-specific 2-thiouridylase
MSKKVMAAMSGGVDSSAAALLLLRQGYEVTGATLKLFSNEDIGLEFTRTCCSLTDVEDARAVCHKLGIEHFVFNFGDLFRADVIGRFVESYLSGRTPNPCIDCNRFIKFDALLERAQLLGLDYIATGHYARIEYDDTTGRYLLKRSADVSKDQTYVLYNLTQEQLRHTLLPLGGLAKTAVRNMAEENGLVNARKPDSQDICFVPDGDYAAFIENALGQAGPPGDFIDTEGRVLGRHKGLIHYTVGQRRGIGLSFDRPKYVVAKNPADNTVVLGDEADLYTDTMTVEDINLISVAALDTPCRTDVKTRYSQNAAPATLYPPSDGRMKVVFDTPQRAVTPGQSAVFYDNDTVLGGGIIV